MNFQHGYVMKPHHVDYTDLKTVGSVEIAASETGGVTIVVKGFEFADEQTCRQNVTKAMAWARDVLDAAVKANTLIPGGHIVSVAN